MSIEGGATLQINYNACSKDLTSGSLAYSRTMLGR